MNFISQATGRRKVTKQTSVTNLSFYEWVEKRTTPPSTQDTKPTASITPRTDPLPSITPRADPTPTPSGSRTASTSTLNETNMDFDPYNDVSSVNSNYNLHDALRELDLVQSDEENL